MIHQLLKINIYSNILIFTYSDYGQISTRLEEILVYEIFILHVQGETHIYMQKRLDVNCKKLKTILTILVYLNKCILNQETKHDSTFSATFMDIFLMDHLPMIFKIYPSWRLQPLNT